MFSTIIRRSIEFFLIIQIYEYQFTKLNSTKSPSQISSGSVIFYIISCASTAKSPAEALLWDFALVDGSGTTLRPNQNALTLKKGGVRLFAQPSDPSQ